MCGEHKNRLYDAVANIIKHETYNPEAKTIDYEELAEVLCYDDITIDYFELVEMVDCEELSRHAVDYLAEDADFMSGLASEMVRYMVGSMNNAD